MRMEVTSRELRSCQRYPKLIHRQFPRPKAKVVQRHFVVPLRQSRKPGPLVHECIRCIYPDEDVFSFDEFVEPFAQIWLHVASQASKGESMTFGSRLSSGRVVSSFRRTKRYSTIHIRTQSICLGT